MAAILEPQLAAQHRFHNMNFDQIEELSHRLLRICVAINNINDIPIEEREFYERLLNDARMRTARNMAEEEWVRDERHNTDRSKRGQYIFISHIIAMLNGTHPVENREYFGFLVIFKEQYLLLLDEKFQSSAREFAEEKFQGFVRGLGDLKSRLEVIRNLLINGANDQDWKDLHEPFMTIYTNLLVEQREKAESSIKIATAAFELNNFSSIAQVSMRFQAIQAEMTALNNAPQRDHDAKEYYQVLLSAEYSKLKKSMQKAADRMCHHNFDKQPDVKTRMDEIAAAIASIAALHLEDEDERLHYKALLEACLENNKKKLAETSADVAATLEGRLQALQLQNDKDNETKQREEQVAQAQLILSKKPQGEKPAGEATLDVKSDLQQPPKTNSGKKPPN